MIGYLSNTGAVVTLEQSWFWPTDEARNVMIDPSTVRFTDDMFRAFAHAVGCGHLLAPEDVQEKMK